MHFQWKCFKASLLPLQFASANIFHWNFWSNTFANNTGAAVFVHLPDTWDLRAQKKHSFLVGWLINQIAVTYPLMILLR